MRTLIDIEETDIEQLDAIAVELKQSRASLIREAVAEYLAKRQRKTIDDAFGLWRNHKIDGLAHQRKMRSEW